jgi:hypothetical protein
MKQKIGIHMEELKKKKKNQGFKENMYLHGKHGSK